MLERAAMIMLGVLVWLPLVGCRQAGGPLEDASAGAAVVNDLDPVLVQAVEGAPPLDGLSGIAQSSPPPNVSEPRPLPPPVVVAPGAAPAVLAEEGGAIGLFGSTAWQQLKAEAHHNLLLANRQKRVRNCQRINVVLIIIDDLGFGDLGVYGQERIKTPNIDTLAQNGVRFTNYYAGSSVGTPSHATLFTGLHTGHCRLRGNGENLSLASSDYTLSKMMFMAGYNTAMFGSWKLGGGRSPGMPIQQGFEEAYGYLDREHALDHYPRFLWRNDVREPIPGNENDGRAYYSHDLVTAEAVEYLQRRHRRPFFLCVSFAPPRGRLDHVPSEEPYSGEDWPREQKQYAAMITRVDDSVGKIVDTLYRLQMKENTVVILTSDNGPHKDGVNPAFFKSTGPFNGIKGTLGEGGIRVPMIVWGPSHIVRTAGNVSDQLWWAPDLMPTLAELAGVWRWPRSIDGVSQLAAWKGLPAPEHEYLYWELHEGGFVQAVRQGPWKAVRNAPGEPVKLYNLEDDPGEENNLASSNAAIAQQLAEIMQNARLDSPDWPIKKVEE